MQLAKYKILFPDTKILARVDFDLDTGGYCYIRIGVSRTGFVSKKGLARRKGIPLSLSGVISSTSSGSHATSYIAEGTLV